MDDVSLLMNDPDFAFKYKVERRQGKWVKGRFKLGEPEVLKFYGPVQPATEKELKQLSIGDRLEGIFRFSFRKPKNLYTTQRGSKDANISDEIIWRGERYKVIRVRPWDHYGWMHAYAVRKGVEDGDDQQNAGTG